jgi:hypothetical protein
VNTLKIKCKGENGDLEVAATFLVGKWTSAVLRICDPGSGSGKNFFRIPELFDYDLD